MRKKLIIIIYLVIGLMFAGVIYAAVIYPQQGGTGVSATPQAGQLLIGNDTNYTLSTLTGTSNEIEITNAQGSITVGITDTLVTSNLRVSYASVSTKFEVGSDKFTVIGASGNTDIVGTLDVTGLTTLVNASTSTKFEVGSDKFVVIGSSGNTDIVGTLDVTGLTTFVNASGSGNFEMGTNKLRIYGATGNLTMSGILNADTAASHSLSGDLTIGDDLYLTGDFMSDFDAITAASHSFTGDLSISDDLDVSGTITGLGAVASDNIDFDELVDAMTLDAALTVASGGNATTWNSDFTIGNDLTVSGVINAFTLGGNITGGNYNITGLTHLGFVTASGSSTAELSAIKTDTLSNSTGTLTINAFTLGGDITGANYDITGLTDFGSSYASISTKFEVGSDKFTVIGSSGNTDIQGTLDVTGVLSFANASGSATLEVLALKTDTLSNSTGTLTINAFTLGGTITADSNDITGVDHLAGATASLSGNIDITGDIDVTGNWLTDFDATLSASHSFTGDLAVGDDVVVTGDLSWGTMSTTVDMSTNTNLTVGATGIELSDDDIALTTNYFIPLIASASNWDGFYQTPSTVITAGTGLTWSTNTINLDNDFGADIGVAELTSEDFGDFTCNGTTCLLDTTVSDSFDFDELVDAMTLDAALSVASGGNATTWNSDFTIGYDGTISGDLTLTGNFLSDFDATTAASHSFAGDLAIADDGTVGGNLAITGDLVFGAVTWNTGDNIDGEVIADNTIDVDSLDWGAFTDLGEGGAVTWGNVAAGELGNDSIINEDIDDDGNFTFTGGWNFSGGVLEVPNAAAPTVDADGELAIDTTGGQLIYFSTVKEVLVATRSFSFMLGADHMASSSWHVEKQFQEPITITEISCRAKQGTSFQVELLECDANGANCSDVDSVITCGTTRTYDDGSLSNPSIDALDTVIASTSDGTITGAVETGGVDVFYKMTAE